MEGRAFCSIAIAMSVVVSRPDRVVDPNPFTGSQSTSGRAGQLMASMFLPATPCNAAIWDTTRPKKRVPFLRVLDEGNLREPTTVRLAHKAAPLCATSLLLSPHAHRVDLLQTWRALKGPVTLLLLGAGRGAQWGCAAEPPGVGVDRRLASCCDWHFDMCYNPGGVTTRCPFQPHQYFAHVHMRSIRLAAA